MKTSNRIASSILIFFGILFMFLAVYWLAGNDFVRCRELAETVSFGALIAACAAGIPWLPTP
jgi:hypothetical protein